MANEKVRRGIGNAAAASFGSQNARKAAGNSADLSDMFFGTFGQQATRDAYSALPVERPKAAITKAPATSIDGAKPAPAPAPKPQPAPIPMTANRELAQEAMATADAFEAQAASEAYDSPALIQALMARGQRARTPSVLTPQAYSSQTAIPRTDERSAMLRAVADMRGAKQGDLYDQLVGNGGFVNTEMMKMAIDDRQKARTGARDDVRVGMEGANARQRSAIDSAKLEEAAAQFGYESQWREPEYQLNRYQMLADDSNNAARTDVLGSSAAMDNINNQRAQQNNIIFRLLEEAGPDPVLGGAPRNEALYNNITAALMGQANFADGGLVRGYADGGEVDPMEGMGGDMAVDPASVGAEAGMDTGDYVIPVEAVRFYGTKMLKGMIEKAMMADD